jgi:hypothetical protein
MKRSIAVLFLLASIRLYAQNVGIGTTTPAYKLQVTDSVNAAILSLVTPQAAANDIAAIRMQAGDDIFNFLEFKKYKQVANGGATFAGIPANNLSVITTGGNSGPLVIATGSGNAPIIFANNTERMRIIGNGNVGIGDTNPLYPVSILKNSSAFSGSYNNTLLHIKNEGNGGGLYSSIENPGLVSSEFPASALIGHAINKTAVVAYTEGSGTALYAYSQAGNGVTALVNTGDAIKGEAIGGNGVIGLSGSVASAGGKFSNTSGGVALQIDNGALKVSGANKTVFQITAVTGPGGNTVGNTLTIPNTTLANQLSDLLIITPVFAAFGGVYCNFPLGVWWNGTNWTIFNQTLGAMPNGAVFNVMVVKQ